MAHPKMTEQKKLANFAASFIPEPNSGCWLWVGAYQTNRPYGTFSAGRGTKDGAHRHSWRIHNGEIPDGICVCHKCDVPECVNPAHLFLGTHKDNQIDCAAKGRKKHRDGRSYERMRRGENNNKSKLTSDSVKSIMASSLKGTDLAVLYGVSTQVISSIKTRRIWRHVE